jgi:ribosomal protein S27E
MNLDYHFFINIADKHYGISIINDLELANRLKNEYCLSKIFCNVDATVKIIRNKEGYIFECSNRKGSTKKFKFSNDLFTIVDRFGYLDQHCMVTLGIECLKAKILFLHGSAYVKNNYATIFLAPSGGGKSTIIQGILKNNLYAEDTVIIKKIKSNFYVFPSSFDRKYVSSTNKRAVLIKNIYTLTKSNKNKVSELNLGEQLSATMNNCIYIQSDPIVKVDKKRLSCLVLDMIKSIPVVKLNFTKNFRAYKNLSKII